MKKTIVAVLIAGSIGTSFYAANFDIGISGSDRGVTGFSLSVGDYYRVPIQQIIYLERSIPRDETSVVYFLARHSHKSPHYITQMRLRGLSWWDISLHLGLDPHMLYVVDARRHASPPYGNAYGYSGKNYRLNDAEIVDLVNVRFLSSYYGVSVDDVIDRRSRGQRYIHIDDDYRAKKYSQMQSSERWDSRNDNRNKHGDQGHGNKKRDNR